MGNDTSTLIKLRRGSKDKDQSQIIICDTTKNSPPYGKKCKRSVSHCRYQENRRGSPPNVVLDDIDLDSRRSSGSTIRGGVENASDSSSFLSPGNGADRRRSRSLCQAQMQADANTLTTGTAPTTPREDPEPRPSSSARKSSSGLVPNLNRLRIQQCYKTAKPAIGESILKRACASRPEIRAFLNRLNDQQMDYMGREMHALITDAVENIDKAEKVLAHARRVGETYAALCPLGFRPDYFAPIADAAIAECVKLDGGMHKRCETLLAWSQLVGALFTAVRDGYYQRVRFQRRSSLPQNTITKQLSIDYSKSVDQPDIVVS